MLNLKKQISALLFLLVFIAGSMSVSSLLAKSNDKESFLSSKVFSKFKKKQIAVTPVKPFTIPSNISACEYFGMTMDSFSKSLICQQEIVPIADEIKFSAFSELPEEYDIWDTKKVNPYDISLVDMKDTVTIDVSNYTAPSQKHITSNFGFRKWKYHYGIDLKVHRGDTVRCAFDGVVRMTRYDRRGYGYFTVVRHSNGLETLYGHLARFIAAEGDTLKSGDPIGLGGNTGRSTGYHLHLEMRYLGNPINPNDIVDFEKHTTKNSVFLLTAQNFEYKKEIDKIRYWTVRKGDTLGHIAMKTGISVSKLCALNGITRNTILRIGRRIRYT